MPEWSELVEGFDKTNERELAQFIEAQRWFGGKGRGISGVKLVDGIVLRDEPKLMIAIVDVRDGSGTSDVYQLVLAPVASDQGADDGRLVTNVGDQSICEASNDPRIAELITSAQGEGIALSGASGEVRFRSIRNFTNDHLAIRPLGGEQSNTALVVDERLFLKLYRRLEAGTNPELELMLFLTEHDFANIPNLAGWSSYGGTGLRATLALAQQYIPDSIDGWSLGMEELERQDLHFMNRLDRLGEIVGEMHRVLSSDANDPSFAPEYPTEEAAAILGARLEGQIDELSELIPDGRSEDLRSLARELTEHPLSGQLIRTHGDLHLGQLLWTGEDWFIIDFEGEPARSLPERRQKLHPLRDVAGLLRSFSYLVAARELDHHDDIPRGWEQQAGERLLASYRTQVAPAGILPSDIDDQDRLLRIFTLEKLLYELDYEIQHRPSWVPVPLAGIDRLLGDSAT